MKDDAIAVIVLSWFLLGCLVGLFVGMCLGVAFS